MQAMEASSSKQPGSIVGGVLQSAMSCCDLVHSKAGQVQKWVSKLQSFLKNCSH